jgi:preprotein translocase SecE subunit
MKLTVYRPSDGLLVRRVAVIGLLMFTAYGCMRWYNWMQDSVNWPFSRSPLPADLNWGLLGMLVIGMGGLGLAVKLCFLSPGPSTFLIETEGELRKVTWPQYKPWFSTEAEVWGSTYVVIVVLLMMSLLLLVIDITLRTISQWIFL